MRFIYRPGNPFKNLIYGAACCRIVVSLVHPNHVNWLAIEFTLSAVKFVVIFFITTRPGYCQIWPIVLMEYLVHGT